MNLSLPLHQNWSRKLSLVLVWAVSIVFRFLCMPYRYLRCGADYNAFFTGGAVDDGHVSFHLTLLRQNSLNQVWVDTIHSSPVQVDIGHGYQHLSMSIGGDLGGL